MSFKTTGLVVTIALGLLAAPPAADAQQPRKIPHIGYLSPSTAASTTDEMFRQALRARGYVDGQNIVMDYRFADGRFERLPDLASDLVRLQVDMIVAVAPPAIQAAKTATKVIPIVMAFSGDDPVESGFVASMARPGGSITGVTLLAEQLSGKRLELLKEAVPRARRVGVLMTPAGKASSSKLKATQVAAQQLGVQLEVVGVREAAYSEAFAAMVRGRAEAVVVLSNPAFFDDRQQIAALAAKNRLPAMYEFKEIAEAGGLMTYGPSFSDLYARVATYVDKILKGAKPADLPVEQPTRFALVINMKTAKALGLTIPPSVLVRADQVIQ